MKKQKMLGVAAIEHGTVIDHIPSDKVMKLVEMLLLDNTHRITIGLNLESKKKGRKGIIKISGRKLTEAEMNKVAILAPDATVNNIEDYEVTKKRKIMLHDIEPNTLRCNNPNCITNNEQTETKFQIVTKSPLRVRCFFCERTAEENELKFL
ncbi:MAG: aspartate carbamoyltransferase regulatory subunit [Nanoarchaeota archaeon]